MYNLKMTLNGETHEVTTDNLREAILSLKPEVLFTEVYMTITKGDFTRDRRLSLKQGKQLFASDTALEIFLINLFL
jgi:hypothetical protein